MAFEQNLGIEMYLLTPIKYFELHEYLYDCEMYLEKACIHVCPTSSISPVICFDGESKCIIIRKINAFWFQNQALTMSRIFFLKAHENS